MNQPSFRDVEMLSAYLDGQLSPVDSTRLETRIKADPALHSVYDDLRQSRALLHKLPARRAPRNFTLTPKMAGIKPPLPRAFPLFRLASALAAVLLFFSFAANLSVPAIATLHAAPPSFAYGRGGGGGPGEQPSVAMAPAAVPATDTPAPVEAAATQAPAAAAPAPTDTSAANQQQDNTLPAPTAEALVPGAQPKLNPNAQSGTRALVLQPQPVNLPVPVPWLYGLLALTIISGGAALLVRTRVEQDWRKANAVKPDRLAARELLLLGLALLVILLLAAGIYWMSTTTFYAPVAQSITFPSGPAGDAKGSGLKGGPQVAGPQSIHLSPGMGFSFSASDDTGLMTAIDFPTGAVTQETDLSYTPGLFRAAPDGLVFANRAFTLISMSNAAALQTPITITMDYDSAITTAANGITLLLYWWSGDAWVDAASTCSPASTYERLPDNNRLRVSVCQLGIFLMVAQ